MRALFTNWYYNSYLRRIIKSLGDRGVARTMALIKQEKWLDLRYGLETGGIVHLNTIETVGNNKEHGFRYEGVNKLVFKEAMDNLGSDPSKYHFIDFGCGKGLAMILASKYGFRALTGVEFSPKLANIAKSNLALYKKKTGIPKAWNIEIKDVANYEMPGKPPYLLFFFNPFNEDVLSKVIASVARQIKPKSDVKIVYINALYDHVLKDQGLKLIHRKDKDSMMLYQGATVIYSFN